jgi:putative ABC transport system substrate-binding protein
MNRSVFARFGEVGHSSLLLTASMNRRIFIPLSTVLLGGAALSAEMLRGRPARIGLLAYGSPVPIASELLAFQRRLRELGWIEGQTATVDYRWAEGNPDRLPALLMELVESKVDVMMLSGSSALLAAHRATKTIPVVFVVLVDPVALGVVASLARPGGNLTGLASQFEEIITKQLELLKEAVPGLSRVGILNQSAVGPGTLKAAESAARGLGLATRTLTVTTSSDFEDAFKAALSDRAGAIHVLPSPYFNAQRGLLIELAARYRLPAFYEFRNYVRDGGLISYGPSIDEMFGRAANYVDRILKGAEPGRLPVERPSKFELVINLKTAATLGRSIPQSLLQRADELIE